MDFDEKLKHIILEVAALMKLHKFKRKKSGKIIRWRREDNGITHLFEIKVNKWDNQPRANLFISAGFSSGEVRKVDECSRRVKGLNSPQVFSTTDEKEMAAEIVAQIKTKVLPTFELADEHYRIIEKSKEVIEYVRIRIAAFLKKNGFTKVGRRYWEKYDGRITYLIVPGLAEIDLTTRSVLISVGIFDLDFHIKHQGGKEHSEAHFSICEPDYKRSLSGLKGRGPYNITLSTSKSKLASEIIKDIKEVAFPWFASYSKK